MKTWISNLMNALSNISWQYVIYINSILFHSNVFWMRRIYRRHVRLWHVPRFKALSTTLHLEAIHFRFVGECARVITQTICQSVCQSVLGLSWSVGGGTQKEKNLSSSLSSIQLSKSVMMCAQLSWEMLLFNDITVHNVLWDFCFLINRVIKRGVLVNIVTSEKNSWEKLFLNICIYIYLYKVI